MSKLSIASFTNLGYRLHSRRFSPIETDMSGNTVVVTGATGGLGLETARTLGALGARVVIVGRDQEKLAEARASGGGQIVTEAADLSLMSDIEMLARRLVEREARIDVLINNVGVLLPERSTTAEGLEKTFATNLAGHFLLTNLLLPRLIDSSPARVINVSSGGMYSERIRPDDLQFERGRYKGTTAYARTKRAQVILTEMWAARFSAREIVFHSMHPGWAKTAGVAQGLPTFNKVMRPLLRSAAEGADTIAWLAAEDEPRQSTGRFWFDRREAPTHMMDSTLETPDDRTRLWEELVELTGSDVPSQPFSAS